MRIDFRMNCKLRIRRLRRANDKKSVKAKINVKTSSNKVATIGNSWTLNWTLVVHSQFVVSY